MTTIDAARPRPTPHALLRSLRIDPTRLHPIEKTLLAFAALLTVVSAAVYLSDVSGTYGGTDIRNRVVGARVLTAGYNPYTFRWQPGMTEEWLDPCDRGDIPRLTIPPTGLVLYQAISWMPYGTLRLVHFGLEWLTLLVTVFVLTSTIPRQRMRVAFLVMTAIGLVAASGSIWRMHTEHGQLYVFHLLLLSLGMRRAMRMGLDSWWAGVAFGLAAALRPCFAPIGLAFLVLGKYRTGFGTLATGALAVLLTLPLTGIDVWKSYAVVGEQFYRSWTTPEEYQGLRDVSDYAEGFQCMYPIMESYSQCGSFARYYSENREQLGLPRIDLGKVSKGVILGLTGALLFALGTGWGRSSPRAKLLLIFVVLLDIEYFLPQRTSYTDIHWLLPLALAVPYLAVPRLIPQVALACILAGVFFGNDQLLATHSLTKPFARAYMWAFGLTAVAVWVYFRPKHEMQATVENRTPNGNLSE